ncbi:transcription factor PRE6-like [Chenopodium quinoa]|uniref:BHLH domain-containing protein n=1 Tax=Chenopodium quinoa TaxID=63459 RepID=A0A803M183_CHEQI|nr:transcription factor PRE6-like [Chenopodium quinoa]
MSSSRILLASRCATEDEISELVFKLQALLPERRRQHLRRVSRDEVLEEVCSYIRKLHKQVDDTSERISQLLASADLDADVLRSLLQQ